MPQYLAPGVYVEEIPGPRTIEGVSTSVAAFVGPCRFGPTSGRPELLTSYLDFVSIYGDAADLNLDSGATPNYVALGVKGFFDEGGSSLYMVRTFAYTNTGDPGDDHAIADLPDPDVTPSGPVTPSAVGSGLTLRARFPGEAGRMRVTFTLKAGGNALVPPPRGPNLTRVHEFDTVWAVTNDSLPDESIQVVRRDAVTGEWYLAGETSQTEITEVSAVYPLTVLVEVQRPSVDSRGLPVFGPKVAVGEFGFDPRAIGTGVSTVLTARPPTRRQELTVPLALEGVADLVPGVSNPGDALPGALAEAIFGATALATAPSSTTSLESRQRVVTLDDGRDGAGPTFSDYDGKVSFNDYANADNQAALTMNGLLALEPVEDISIVAAPGASTGWRGTASDAAEKGREINNSITAHCERMLYRVAALDTPRQLLPTAALDYRNFRSSTHAALYYPWVTVGHPIDGRRIDVPPAPYMAGIWARSDNLRGVIKAPANEVVRSALDLETRVNKAQQELLNPEGVNCLRFFPGPGFLVWGARTISDDPEWKYLSIRRYFNYLERSIDQGTQWVVFEVNGPALWDAVRHTVEGFLFNEWKNGALLGRAPEEGYFVRCDESTMTAEDLDNGRLICIIGVAAAKPAEFVIFRISQFTATTSS
jgi:Bacteriophage tail sheath protein